MVLQDLVKSVPAMRKLRTMDLPINVSFRLQLFLKKYDDILKSFDNSRVKLVEKLGEKNPEDENEYIILENSENWEEFTTELDKLMAEEIDIEIPKIYIGSLGDLQISAEDLMHLSFLFTTEE